jgi:N-alpha-acetyl-L-2,4-diaminobutyrate deacetylase
MMSSRSPVITDIDFDKDGKQTSYLRVPHSRNTSAWGKVLIPIIVIKNGSGPTVLLVGGNHGGEYEGPVSLMKLSRELQEKDVQGRIIILPALNFPAVAAGERVSPVDGRDMNRSFPGQPNGTITQVIAHYVHEAILPLCDVVLDLHAGGYSLDLGPFIGMHYLADEKQRAATEAAMRAFQAPYALILEEFTGEGLLDYAVESMGKVFLFTELGGAGRLRPDTLAIAEVGTRNLLKHYHIIAGDIVTCEARGMAAMKLMEVPDPENYLMVTEGGIYESFHTLGTYLETGQPVGQLHFIQHPLREPQVVRAPCPGTLLGTRGPGLVEPGDCVALITRHLEAK